MTFIVTFLGKGGVGRTTVAIAAAQRLANQGKRTLLIGQGFDPVLSAWLGQLGGSDPQVIAPNLSVVQPQLTVLLERAWEAAKKLEAEYLRNPVFKSIFAEELAVLPGMDSALAMTMLFAYYFSDRYDCIVYDGAGDQAMLRMLGSPDSLGWYIRRFRQIFAESDLAKTVLPLLQPLMGSMFNLDWTSDSFAQPASQVNRVLDQLNTVVNDPSRMAAYLVMTGDRATIAMARYLWGAAQQAGLTVAGAIVNQSLSSVAIANLERLTLEFAPLPIHAMPVITDNQWQPALESMPDLIIDTAHALRAMVVDLAESNVRLFLPGFDKKQVKLSQNGPEVTIEAGDQRRNILLPPELSGKPVIGAKFQDGYLTIRF